MEKLPISDVQTGQVAYPDLPFFQFIAGLESVIRQCVYKARE